MNRRPLSASGVTGSLIAFLCLLLAPAAQAGFGLVNPDVAFTDAGGSSAMEAGSHPYAFTTSFDVNTVPAPGEGVLPDGEAKDVLIDFPPGLVGTPITCSST